MNDGPPRRRRPREANVAENRNALPLFPLVLVVILVGLGLGYIGSRLFVKQSPPATTTAAEQTSTPTIAPAARPTLTPSPVAHPSRKPSSAPPSPAVHSTPHRIALSAPHPTPSPGSPRPLAATPATVTPAPRTPAPQTPSAATSKPATLRSVAPKPPSPTPHPAPAPPLTGSGAAAQLARTYLEALMSGDPVSANRALGRAPDNGDFPEKGFLTKTSRITSVRSSPNGDGTYKVEAEIQGGNGTFFCTFQTARNDVAQYLSEHDCIKVN